MTNANTQDTSSVAPADAAPTTTSTDTLLAPVQVTTASTVDGAIAPPEPVTPSHSETPSCTNTNTEATTQEGVGLDGETVIWEGQYSFRNFMGRSIIGAILLIGLAVAVYYTWGDHVFNLLPITLMVGLAVLVYWGSLLNRMLHARFGHGYRLTNKRLFVASGLLLRREDQMELLRVKDVFLRQSLVGRWMDLGTVVVVSTERELPVFYLTGIENPRPVLDLIWHHARAERGEGTTNPPTA